MTTHIFKHKYTHIHTNIIYKQTVASVHAARIARAQCDNRRRRRRRQQQQVVHQEIYNHRKYYQITWNHHPTMIMHQDIHDLIYDETIITNCKKFNLSLPIQTQHSR